jgi:hypothetical protein
MHAYYDHHDTSAIHDRNVLPSSYLSKLLAFSLAVLLLFSVLMIGAEVETVERYNALHQRAYFIPMISMSMLATIHSRHWIQNDTTIVNYGLCGEYF